MGVDPTKMEKNMNSNVENNSIRVEMDKAIEKLENMGLNPNSHKNEDTTGLGDVVESVLSSFGITEEKFKKWFNLRECGCSKRKKYLNNLFSWKKNNS